MPTSFAILVMTRSLLSVLADFFRYTGNDEIAFKCSCHSLNQSPDKWRAQLYTKAFLTSSSGTIGKVEIFETSPVCHLSIFWGYPGNDEIADLAKVADAGGVLGQHRVPPADHTVQNCHDKSLKRQKAA